MDFVQYPVVFFDLEITCTGTYVVDPDLPGTQRGTQKLTGIDVTPNAVFESTYAPVSVDIAVKSAKSVPNKAYVKVGSTYGSAVARLVRV